MLKSALKLEFLKTKHLSNHWVDIKYIDNYQYDEKDWKDNIEGLSEYWNNICLTHHFRKRSFAIVDNLKEIITKRCGNSWAVAIISDKLHGKEHQRWCICLLIPIQSIIAGKFKLEEWVVHAEYDIAHHNHQWTVKSYEGLDMH
jgi:hypothetical protein